MNKIFSILLSFILLFTIFPFMDVHAQTVPTVTVSNSVGNHEQTVEVKISIKDNPGVLAMAFCVQYNSSAFEYVGYKDGYLTDYNIKDHKTKGYVSFVNVEDSDVSQNGTMLTLCFKIKKTAALGKYDVSILNNNPEKYGDSLHNSFANSKEQYIVPVLENGSITVTDMPILISGDINNDNAVNNKDLGLLMQYINNWNVEINIYTADVNDDGAINNKDYGLLMQYINNWDVELQ